ncbi:GMC family oxidoreductase (plasmid) [Skermanella sp. TT6]|uniref:GMC family oxidoreductase n=1 Tax=Skermanella cutis TaxID=2775420 RepID=A0ABX7BKU6_9PROT|nr:GMC family oxidoreductase [Skermanella sp. TT6]QQP93647.1 GMC family oxidoreductase [Skermanella sp. TT6]
MFIDINGLDEHAELEADICIIGAGPAGISMARDLIGTPVRVLLLESGELEFDGDTQELYASESIGIPYFALDQSRLRYFGGSSNHWDNWCGEFEPIDFRQRSWVPDSGWPFGIEELYPYYDRARPLCGLPPRRSTEWIQENMGVPPLPFDGSRLKYHFWEIAGPPIRFGEAYGAELREAPNIRVVFNANATELRTDEAGGVITSVELRSLKGRVTTARARFVVLACGGMENARLMLDSDRVQPNGIGNRHDLVGRYFMDHPLDRVGSIVTSDPMKLIDALRTSRRGKYFYFPSVVLTETAMEREQVLNSRIQLRFTTTENTLPMLQRVGRAVAAGQVPSRPLETVGELLLNADIVAYNLYRRMIADLPIVPKPASVTEVLFTFQAEQAPNPNSRIMLSDKRNALGGRQMVLDWRLSELEKRSLHVQTKLLGAELARMGLGLFRMESWLAEGANSWSPDVVIGYHHMGTTRMADDELRGVVDRQCRVHGMDNLYIAGSSVFPTGSNINPTLTIVALALRLTDHLKQRVTTTT